MDGLPSERIVPTWGQPMRQGWRRLKREKPLHDASLTSPFRNRPNTREALAAEPRTLLRLENGATTRVKTRKSPGPGQNSLESSSRIGRMWFQSPCESARSVSAYVACGAGGGTRLAPGDMA